MEAVSKDTNYLEALALIDKEFAELPDGTSLVVKIKERLDEIHARPPLNECQNCLQLPSLTNEELRGILFYPSLNQVKYYALLLANKKLCSMSLTLIFLLHRYKILIY